MVSPVIQPEAGARNTATEAMLSGLSQPSERCACDELLLAADDAEFVRASVSTLPGLMALTRILFGPSSFASTRVNVSSAPLWRSRPRPSGSGCCLRSS